MASDDSERLLVEIGQLLAEDTEYHLNGTLLYSQLAHWSVATAIFKERGNHVLYRWPDPDRLDYALLELWEAQDTDDRWAEIEYVIRDGTFDVTYTFPEDIDPDEDTFVRRDRIVQRHFGDKPIVYPPLPMDDDVPTYDL